MKTTVITVCRNSAETIAETIKSVQSQIDCILEYVIIDGASTDGTQKIIEKHATTNTVLLSEPDSGIYDAMNKGLRMATGDAVVFIGADDTFLDNTVLARVTSKMAEHQLDAILGDVIFYDKRSPEKILRRYDSSRFSPDKIPWGWMPAHPAMFLRREIYETNGPFRTDYRIAGDFEFIARAFWKKNLRYQHLSEVLVRMRIGGVSTGGLRNTILLNQEVLRACRENKIPTNIFKILSKYPAKMLEYMRI